MAQIPQNPQPAPKFGITLALYPSPGQAGFSVELQRGYGTTATMISIATLSQLDGGATLMYADELPATTGTVVHYRARHVRAGWNDGAFTPTVSDVAGQLPIQPPDKQLEGARRLDTFYKGDAVFLAVAVQSDGVSNLGVSKGLQGGTVNGGELSTGTWLDGPTVSFPIQYSVAPTVTMFPGAGTRYNEPDVGTWSSTAYSSTVGQSVELEPVGVSATGFTPRARLSQAAGAITDRSEAYGAGTLTTVGEAIAQALGNTPAYNDQYTNFYDVTVTRNSTDELEGTARVTVAIDLSSVGSASTVWSEQSVETEIFLMTSTAAQTNSSENQLNVMAGVTSTYGIRQRFKSVTVTGTITTGDFAVSIDPNRVTFQSSTATSIFAPMCPTTSDTVRWIAESKSAST